MAHNASADADSGGPMRVEGWQDVGQLIFTGPCDQVQAALVDAQLVGKAALDVTPSYGHLDGVRYEFRVNAAQVPAAEAIRLWEIYFRTLRKAADQHHWFLAGAPFVED